MAPKRAIVEGQGTFLVVYRTIFLLEQNHTWQYLYTSFSGFVLWLIGDYLKRSKSVFLYFSPVVYLYTGDLIPLYSTPRAAVSPEHLNL